MKRPILKSGDTIGIMSTSCWVPDSELHIAAKFMEERGYKTLIHPQATERLHQSAGSAKDKANALHDLFLNPDIKAIIGARGGNRAITMLEHIDFDIISKNPKIIMGYSDVTILLNAIYAKTGISTFHGPLFRELPKHEHLSQMFDVLSGTARQIPLTGARILKAGKAKGTLIGGNLSMLQTLSGTGFQPDTNGAILFIEDIGDHLSRYDRMLAHLKLSGWLDNISGLIVGNFGCPLDDEDRPFGFSFDDIILEHTAHLDIPIIMDAPFGHKGIFYTFPIGSDVHFSTDQTDINLILT